MKKIPQNLDDQLLNYLDGVMTDAERKELEIALQADGALRERLSQLQHINAVLKNAPVENPSVNFTAQVMAKLDRPPLTSRLSISNGIILLLGVLVAMGVGVWLLSQGVFDQTTTIDLNTIPVTKEYLQQNLPSIPLSGKMVMNIIILLNLALAFVLLDRVILKQIFQRRMQAGH